MELKEAVVVVEQSDAFTRWKKDHQDWKLAHGILLEDGWHVGYTNGHHMATFTLNPVKVEDDQETYKPKDEEIKSLDVAQVTLTLQEAKEAFENVREEHYPSEVIMKPILLIQQLEQPVYNITGVTMSFQTINVKLDMQGQVLDKSKQALIQRL